MGVLHERGESEEHEIKALRVLEQKLPSDWHLTTEVVTGQTNIDSILACPYGFFCIELKHCNGTVIPHSEKQWEGAGLPAYLKQKAKKNPFRQAERNAKILRGQTEERGSRWFVDYLVILSGRVLLKLDAAELDSKGQDEQRVTVLEHVEDAVQTIFRSRGARRRVYSAHEIEKWLLATKPKLGSSRKRFVGVRPSYLRISDGAGFDHVYYSDVQLRSHHFKGTGDPTLTSSFVGGGLLVQFRETGIELKIVSTHLNLATVNGAIGVGGSITLAAGQHCINVGTSTLTFTVG